MKKQIVILVALLWFFAVSKGEAASPLLFNHLSGDQGLPQVTVRTMLMNNGLLWVGTEAGLVKFDGKNLEVFKQNKSENSISDNYISSLALGPSGDIWVGTLGGGLNRLIEEGSKIVQYPGEFSDEDVLDILPEDDVIWIGSLHGLLRLDPDSSVISRVQIKKNNSPFFKTVKGIARDGTSLWFITKGSGLGRYFPDSDHVDWFEAGKNGLQANSFNTIFKDTSGRLWAGSENLGLVSIDTRTSPPSFKHYSKQSHGLGANDLMAISDAGDGRLWLGSWNGGLQLFDPEEGILGSYRHSMANPRSLCSNILTKIISAPDGTLFIGSYDRGLSWVNPNPVFKTIVFDPLAEEKLPDNMIWSFCEDDSGNIWTGTSHGIARVVRSGFHIDTPVSDSSIPEELGRSDIRSMTHDGKSLWVGTKSKGLFRYDIELDLLIPFQEEYESDSNLCRRDVRVLLNDAEKGFLWAGTGKGLNRINLSTGTVEYYFSDSFNPGALPHDRIRSLFKAGNGVLYVGTSLGLARYSYETNSFIVWQKDRSDPEKSLAGEGVRAIAEDSSGRLWLATESGVSLFNCDSGVIRNFYEEDGLSCNAVYGIMASGGYLWASTMKGLTRINPDTFEMQCYYKSDGLPDNEFNYNAWTVLGSGEVVLGGVNGLVVFVPEEVPGPEKPTTPPLLNIKMKFQGDNTVSSDKTHVFPTDHPAISFEYFVSDFKNVGNIKYFTRLKGASEDWLESGAAYQKFTGLKPDSYLFEVKAVDRHGQWETPVKAVSFTVSAPFWRTWPAWLIYAFVCWAMGVLVSRYAAVQQKKRADWLESEVARHSQELLKSNLELEQKNRQLDSLIETRERLYRSIAHELRTPLTIIMSAIEKQLAEPDGIRSGVLEVALKNVERISRLITTFLNLAKEDATEGGQLFAVDKALEESVASFNFLANDQGKTFDVAIGSAVGSWVEMNREMFITAVGNLLSNALKYSDCNGHVSLRASAKTGFVEIDVIDDGPGIPDKQQERIFEWFSRDTNSEEEGWGIGLPTVKDIVERYDGSISLRCTAQGTIFTISLPLHSAPDENSFNVSKNKLADPEVLFGKTILIVEDEPDLLDQISDMFEPHCTVRKACNGDEGLDYALKHKPDLVISDVRMPGKDGLELLQQLKDSEEIGHIPVMLLSAYEGLELRMLGFNANADACLGKPFNRNELLLRAAALIKNRELSRIKAKQLILSIDDNVQAPRTERIESDLFERIREATGPLEDFLDMSQEDVAGKMNMSKRTLQREFNAVGIKWVEFKRLQQVRYSMELLRNTQLSISDVAARCGFSSSSYFSKVFKDETGKSPSVWRDNTH